MPEWHPLFIALSFFALPKSHIKKHIVAYEIRASVCANCDDFFVDFVYSLCYNDHNPVIIFLFRVLFPALPKPKKWHIITRFLSNHKYKTTFHMAETFEFYTIH